MHSCRLLVAEIVDYYYNMARPGNKVTNMVESPTSGNFREIPINQFKQMEQPAEICENYQLKWGSYTSYIHSCISNSIISEDSYTDVALVTMDGHKIMAHRFVLSYASQYLSKALKFQPKVTTSLPIMIVLPQDITFKALKILVKYMYSGEATVSKDVLNSVLLAGDILKIKGLYREEDDRSQQQRRTSSSQNSQRSTTPSTTNAPNPPQLKQKQQILNQKALEPAAVPSVSSATQSGSASSSSSSKPNVANPQVRKETSQKVNVLNSKILMQGKPIQAVPGSQQIKVYQARPRVLNFTMNNGGVDKENMPEKSLLIKNKDKPHTITSSEAEGLDSPGETIEHMTIKAEASKTGDGVQYLVIKDEPVEWGDTEMDIDDKLFTTEDGMKIEHYDSNSNASIDIDEKSEYSPLTCELCTETFTVPAEWVRHVQTHTDMLPAKRRRRDSPEEDDDENATFPELECDLCKTVFSTPAEWVRHIQDTHTEFELSLSNKNKTTTTKKQIDTPTIPTHRDMNPRICPVCLKIFGSNAAMVVHHRSHTGLSPYTCKYCGKDFNVKSNLVRHLRTVHNKTLNPRDMRFESELDRLAEEEEAQEKIKKPVELPKKLECDLCKTLFQNPTEWVKHFKDAHNQAE